MISSLGPEHKRLHPHKGIAPNFVRTMDVALLCQGDMIADIDRIPFPFDRYVILDQFMPADEDRATDCHERVEAQAEHREFRAGKRSMHDLGDDVSLLKPESGDLVAGRTRGHDTVCAVL